MTSKLVSAQQQFIADHDGKTVVVIEGARFPSTAPVVKANPTMFAPVARPKAARPGA